jgi:hypothetical protein
MVYRAGRVSKRQGRVCFLMAIPLNIECNQSNLNATAALSKLYSHQCTNAHFSALPLPVSQRHIRPKLHNEVKSEELQTAAAYSFTFTVTDIIGIRIVTAFSRHISRYPSSHERLQESVQGGELLSYAAERTNRARMDTDIGERHALMHRSIADVVV